MRQLLLLFALFGVCILACSPHPTNTQGGSLAEGDQVLRRAFEQRTRNLQVEGEGAVRHVLSDDNDGSRHQRFILELGSGQTLLIAHNIDVAPRILEVQEGDNLQFRGEYEWNPEGGVIHWTHHDPTGRHPGGWLKHKGKTYQ